MHLADLRDIRAIPRIELTPPEQFERSLTFREAEVVLCRRIFEGPLTSLREQGERIEGIVDKFITVGGSIFTPLASLWRSNHLRAIGKVVQDIQSLIDIAQGVTTDEYKFEHCLDFLIMMDKNLRNLAM